MAEQQNLQEIFVTGLRNAHAMEHQALSLMDRQIEHLANYAEVETRLRSHRGETERQLGRLDTILRSFGETNSVIKDTTMVITGNLAALAHMLAPDEILKNSFANFAFENFEAASYKALIVMAQEGGFTEALPLLEESLREELAMVTFLDKTLPLIVKRYIALRETGETAGH